MKMIRMMTKSAASLGSLLLFTLLLAPLCVFGDFLDENLSYGFESGSETRVYVYGLKKSATHITIPSTVVYEYTDYNDKDDEGKYRTKRRTCTVTSIRGSAFYNCSSLASVTIPSSVTSIVDYAFYGCSSLASMTIPSSVTSIGDYAFRKCTSLASATVPQCVMAKGLYNIFHCPSGIPIRRLTLDATVSAIHENTFYYCKSLTTIEVDPANEHYFVSPMDGCLYDRDGTTLLFCPRNKTGILLPDVTKIANYACAYCSNLVSVAMPFLPLKTIGEYAFYDCTSLPTVAIPEGVTDIGNYAFGNCRKLSGVTIPSGVQALSTTAFDGCDILWTEWYRTLADFAVNGRAYDLTRKAGDRAIADVTVDGDMALDTFVLKEGKVYDSVLYIHNNADHAVRVTLPSMPLTDYKTFKGASPLTLPAYSTSILTITRVAAGNAGGNVFLVTREELETVK